MTITPVREASSSLYQIALDAQEIDGELAIAMAAATSDDPEEAVQAEALIQGVLERANGNQVLLRSKANALCAMRESLLGRAACLQQQAADRAARAKADEEAAERLLRYLVRTLSALNPGQTSFRLDEFDLTSRAGETTEIIDAERLDPGFCRHEITIKVPSEAGSTGPDLHQKLTAWLGEQVGDFADQCSISIEASPDKALIKSAIKAAPADDRLAVAQPQLPVHAGAATHGETVAAKGVPGAIVQRKRTWSVK